MNWKKIRLTILIVVGVLFLLRSTGFVKLNLYVSQIHDSISMILDIERAEDEVSTLTRYREAADVYVDSNNKSWGVGFRFRPSDPFFADFSELLMDSLSDQHAFTATVEDIELGGLYWLPLLKSGECSYRVRVQGVSDGLTFAGNLNGTATFSISGLSTIDEARRAVAKQMAKDISSTVTNKIKEVRLRSKETN